MQITAAPTASASPSPALGRLIEHDRGVPGHGEFVLARTGPASSAQTVQLATKAGSRMWRSPDDNLDRVLDEARAVAHEAGQAVAIITAEPGHWQQLFVVPLFRLGADGAYDAVRGVAEIQGAAIERGHHLVALADEVVAFDVRSAPVAEDLLPPRARPSSGH